MTRRTPAQYDFEKLLFDERLLKKHFTPQKSKSVEYIVVHHMVIRDMDPTSDDGLDALYKIWQVRPASAQYGVDGKFIGQFVWDKDYAWASGTTHGNRYGIHIEHVNKTLDEAGTANDYLVSEETWKTGAKLAAYLHKKYNLGRPIKDETLKKHSDFKATACPGPFLGGKIWDQYVKEAQRVYDEITKPKKTQKVRRSIAEISLQFNDNDQKTSDDIEKVFKQDYDYVLGTEVGRGSGSVKILRELCRKYGYRLSRDDLFDTWVAVKKSRIKKGSWKKGAVPVLPDSDKFSPKPPGRWGAKGVVWARFDDAEVGEVNLGSIHALTWKSTGTSLKKQTDDDYMTKLGLWANRVYKRPSIVFAGGDFNRRIDRHDVFFGEPFTTSFNEKKVFPKTHKNGPIDGIGSYDRNRNVRCVSTRVREGLGLNTDHSLVEAVYEIEVE